MNDFGEYLLIPEKVQPTDGKDGFRLGKIRLYSRA